MKMLTSSQNILIFVVVWLFALPFAAMAQSPAGHDGEYTWEQFVDDYQQYVGELSEDAENSVERYDWLETLEEVHRNPIDLNVASRAAIVTAVVSARWANS